MDDLKQTVLDLQDRVYRLEQHHSDVVAGFASLTTVTEKAVRALQVLAVAMIAPRNVH